MKPHILVILLAALACAPHAGAQERQSPGLWEIETRHGHNAPLVLRRCLAVEDAAGANGDVNEMRAALEKAAPGCRIDAVTADDQFVTFHQTCGAIVQEAEFRYHGETMEGRITVLNHGRPGMALTYRGKRLDSCP